MDLKQWRQQREDGEEYELPSGLVVKLRRVGLMDLAEQGSIPAPMVGQVDAVMKLDTDSLSLDTIKEFGAVVNLVVKAAMIEPRVEDEPADGVLGIAELPMSDRMQIFGWANASGGALKPFRRRQ